MWTTSGLASLRSSIRLSKYRLIGNLLNSCRAISGSLSQTPTISHPLILWICDACASAILPHPTMATLSKPYFLPAAFKIPLQTVRRGHLWSPVHPHLHFYVAVTRLLPIRVPPHAIKCRWQLTF